MKLGFETTLAPLSAVAACIVAIGLTGAAAPIGEKCTWFECTKYLQRHVGDSKHVFRCKNIKCVEYAKAHVGISNHVYKCADPKCSEFSKPHVGVSKHVYDSMAQGGGPPAPPAQDPSDPCTF